MIPRSETTKRRCCFRSALLLLSCLLCLVHADNDKETVSVRNKRRAKTNLRKGQLPSLYSSTVADSAIHNVGKTALSLSNDFPPLDDCLEMAALSGLVYSFKNELNDTNVCIQVNNRSFAEAVEHKIPFEAFVEDLHCHYYLHNHDVGTQVMILSSASLNYLAVVFAGTDNLETILTDVNILVEPFGDGVNYTVPDVNAYVHKGFNEAVFYKSVYGMIEQEWDAARLQLSSDTRLMTTGHSLGAAASVLTAIELTMHLQNMTAVGMDVPSVTSINFGCPQTGVHDWGVFVNTSPVLKSLAIWRLVLGWDLVPRLPNGFQHVGHTIQLNKAYSNSTNMTAQAYYQHYGDASLMLAGVPFGWSEKPYIWVPGALFSHLISKYWEYLHMYKSGIQESGLKWVDTFEMVHEYNGDDAIFNNTDDFWIQPPAVEML
jgi:Lipase (class 3)